MKGISLNHHLYLKNIVASPLSDCGAVETTDIVYQNAIGLIYCDKKC